VTYVSITEEWAQMAIAGPKSRATLQKVVDGVTLDDTTFPYLAAKEIDILGGIPARLFRISFSGEHAYELAVPADYGSMVAAAVMKAGEEFGIAPYGVEALSIMRIEKGHVAGNELNGTTTAADLGLGKLIGTRTWGGLIGISTNPPLIDGGRLTVPFFRMFTPEGQWRVENEGVAPDLDVPLDPLAVNEDRDPQLDAAIAEVLEELKSAKPIPLKSAPPVPTQMGK